MNFKRLTILTLTQLFIISVFAGSVVHGFQRTDSDVASIEEMKVVTYTYEELLELAKKNSRGLKKKEQEIERSEIMREEAARAKTYTPIGTGTGDPSDVLARAATQGLLAADINIGMLKKQLESEEDKLGYNVKTAFNKVILAKNQLRLDENAKEIAELELKQANLQFQNGLIGKIQLENCQDALREAINKLNTSKLNLEGAYLELNKLVGLGKDERYNLKVEENQEREVPELEIHIRKVLSESPSIFSLEKSVELSEWLLKLHSYNAGQDPYKAKEIDISTTKMSLSDVKETIEYSLRTLHQTLEQLKETKEILQLNLKKTRENLEIAELKLELGMAVPLEVKKLQNIVAELEHKLMENGLKYEEILAVYEKPWVAGN